MAPGRAKRIILASTFLDSVVWAKGTHGEVFRPSVIHALCGLCDRAGNRRTSLVSICFIMDGLFLCVPFESIMNFAV